MSDFKTSINTSISQYTNIMGQLSRHKHMKNENGIAQANDQLTAQKKQLHSLCQNAYLQQIGFRSSLIKNRVVLPYEIDESRIDK